MKTHIVAALAVLVPSAFAPFGFVSGAQAQVPSGTGTTTPMSAMPPVGRADHGGKDTSDVANGPTSGHNTPLSRTEAPGSAIPPSSNAPVTGQVRGAPSGRFNSGTSEVGNSAEGSGQLGASGGGASATMQNGHLNNR